MVHNGSQAGQAQLVDFLVDRLTDLTYGFDEARLSRSKVLVGCLDYFRMRGIIASISRFTSAENENQIVVADSQVSVFPRFSEKRVWENRPDREPFR